MSDRKCHKEEEGMMQTYIDDKAAYRLNKIYESAGGEGMKPRVIHYRMKLYPDGMPEAEIDRAMEWVVEYLREEEAIQDQYSQYDDHRVAFAHENMNRKFDVCIRYLEKVEAELEVSNG